MFGSSRAPVTFVNALRSLVAFAEGIVRANGACDCVVQLLLEKDLPCALGTIAPMSWRLCGSWKVCVLSGTWN